MPLTERKLIERIRRSANRRSANQGASVVTGIGDDAAVLRIPQGHELLVTTDFSIENVHFRRDWHPPELVGWRCLTRGLSDIAAMGGEPRAAFLSLAISSDVPQKWVNGFMKGLLNLAAKFDVPLAGGDTAQSAAGIQADIVVIGSVPKGKAVLRSGAKPGDFIYVTGALGGSAAALALFRKSKRPNPFPPELLRQLRPMPRIAAGLWLRQRGIPSAMIDMSDGLSTDLNHICEESRVGAEIEAEAIPRPQIPRKEISRETGPVALELALHGGDDYELLFTSAAQVPPEVAGVSVTRIGRITKTRGMQLLQDGTAHGATARRLQPGGWEHFRKKN
jgi:thiamine-monophosphate kinase